MNMPGGLQVLGVVLISGGALAVMGSNRRDRSVLTASLLLSLLGILLAFEFAVEVSCLSRLSQAQVCHARKMQALSGL